jgi:hypothetical protein
MLLEIAVVACLVVGLLLFAWHAALPYQTKESSYLGRPTSYWSKEVRAWCEANPPASCWGGKEPLPAPTDPGANAPLLWRGDPAAVPVQAELLQDPDRFVRERAAEELGGIGPAARAAIPALTEALKDPDQSVRQLAAEAITKIDPEAAHQAGGWWPRRPFSLTSYPPSRDD